MLETTHTTYFFIPLLPACALVGQELWVVVCQEFLCKTQMTCVGQGSCSASGRPCMLPQVRVFELLLLHEHQHLAPCQQLGRQLSS